VEFGPAEAAEADVAESAESVPGDAREHVDEDLGLRFWLRRG
jgi:hypothetical protein